MYDSAYRVEQFRDTASPALQQRHFYFRHWKAGRGLLIAYEASQQSQDCGMPHEH